MSRLFNLSSAGYIQSASNPIYNNLRKITVSAWVFLKSNPVSTGPGPYHTAILVKDPNTAFACILAVNSARYAPPYAPGFVFTPAQSGSVGSTGTMPALNVWTHVVATWDNSLPSNKVHVYVNGVDQTKQRSDAADTFTDDSNDGWWIGNDTISRNFDGNIAEVAIWNTVLTPAQVAALATGMTRVRQTMPSSLVSYWPLCGVKSPEPDIVNGNNGTIQGASLPIRGPNPPYSSGCPVILVTPSAVTGANQDGSKSLSSPLIPVGYPLVQIPGAMAETPQTLNPSDPSQVADVAAELSQAGQTGNRVI